MSDRHATCPYRQRPDSAFWARSVAGIARDALTPVVEVPFRITRKHRIASAGSCFAQHMAKRVKESGYSYFVTEPRHPHVPVATAAKLNYEVFSARYGNIYTVRQLVQLFDRAYGAFSPLDTCWEQDGAWVDPFRPFVQPNGFSSRQELEYDRTQHLAAVRRLFEQLDILVFTLGLTEGWRSKQDGAVYPVCPGCGAGTHDPGKHEFVNVGVDDVVADLEAFLERLHRVNPQGRMILTVSPVPLVATMEPYSVLVATTQSKAVLRVAADVIARSRSDVAYFPAYEIITGSYARGEYFADDLRTVTSTGVDHVMRCFYELFCEDGVPASTGTSDELNKAPSVEPPDATARIMQAICDEEQIEG